MKKHVFSLMMVLSLVVIAGTSAFAQNDATTNASGDRYLMIAGSASDFSITRGEAGSGLAWTLVHENAAAQTETNPISDPTLETFRVTWDKNASGNYYVQVVETSSNGTTCVSSTTRRFYITVIDFDVYVYASESDGSRISGDDLIDCGDGTTARYGDEGPGNAFSNTWNTDGDLNASPTVLADVQALDPDNDATDGVTRRYISIGVVWSASAAVADADVIAALVDQITFDYDITSISEAAALVNVNSNAATTGTNQTIAGTKNTPALLTGVHASSFSFTFSLDILDLWDGAAHNDITYQCEVTNVRLVNTTTGSIVGAEPSGNQNLLDATTIPALADYGDFSNISEQTTIKLAPATSTIGVSFVN